MQSPHQEFMRVEAAIESNVTLMVGIRYSRFPTVKSAAPGFEVDILEITFMKLIEKARHRSTGQKMASAAGMLGAASMMSLLFATGLSIAQATANQSSYAGIWKLTAQDKRVGTLELMNYNGRLTGSLTNAHATMDRSGKLVQFDAIPGAAPIVQTSISQGVLVINTEQIDEAIVPWNMTLTGEGKGLLQLAVKGHEMTFQITRISWEENEAGAETAK
jgi:hypothetical protein